MLVIKLKEQIRVKQGALSGWRCWHLEQTRNPERLSVTPFFTDNRKALTAKFSHFNPTNELKIIRNDVRQR